MSPIEKLPELDWSDHAKQEVLATNADELVARSDFAWRIGHVAIVGLIYHSLTSPPWMWFALARGVTLRDLIDFRRMQTMIPPGTLVAVNEAFEQGIRFAKFYGFVATDAVHEHNGNNYRVYRRA